MRTKVAVLIRLSTEQALITGSNAFKQNDESVNG